MRFRADLGQVMQVLCVFRQSMQTDSEMLFKILKLDETQNKLKDFFGEGRDVMESVDFDMERKDDTEVLMQQLPLTDPY